MSGERGHHPGPLSRASSSDAALRKAALEHAGARLLGRGSASVAIGAPLAWLTARTDVPAAAHIRRLVLASFVTPPFLGAFAWVMLAGPNAGLLNRLWRA